MDIVSAQETALTTLLGEGLVYLAICVARSEARPTKLAIAQFCVLIREAALPGDRPPIADGLAQRNDPRDITFEELPAGNALVVDEVVTAAASLAPLGQAAGRVGTTRCAQVILAFPDKRRIATLVLSAENDEDWVHYRRLFRVMARSVSFVGPPTRHSSDRVDELAEPGPVLEPELVWPR